MKTMLIINAAAIAIVWFASTGCSTCSKKQINYYPTGNVVTTEKEAVEIGKAIFSARFGPCILELEAPIYAVLRDGIWDVRGTFNENKAKGGVAQMLLSSTNAEVLMLGHSK